MMPDFNGLRRVRGTSNFGKCHPGSSLRANRQRIRLDK